MIMARLFIILAMAIVAAIQPAIAQTATAQQRREVVKALNAQLPQKYDEEATFLEVKETPQGELCFVFMMHTGAGNATNAAGAEMNAIASAIIGGTLLSGGVGNVIGTLFGTLTLTTIKAIVTTSGLRDPWWQSITTGAMLCFFILLQSVVLSNRGKGGLKKMVPQWMKITQKD